MAAMRGIVDPVLSGIFHEAIMTAGVSDALRAVPLNRIDGISAQYHTMKGHSIVHLNQDGYDPLQPLSNEAPSREVRFQTKIETLETSRFAEHFKVLDREKRHEVAAGISGLEEAKTRGLASIFVSRFLLQFGRLVSTSGNYTNTGASINVGDPDADLLGILGGELEKIRLAAGGSTAGRPVLVASPTTALRLRRLPAVAGSLTSGTTFAATNVGAKQLEDWFADALGITLHVERGVYVDNVTAPSTPVVKPVVGDDLLALVWSNEGQHLSAPTWGHTPAQLFDQDQVAQIRIDPMTAPDPVGHYVTGEAWYGMEVVNKDLGSLISVTNTSPEE